MWKNIEIINPITGEFDANNFQMELNNRLRYYFSHIDLSALSIGSTGSLTLYQISATTANLVYISSTGSATLNLFASSSGRIGQLSSTGSATFNTLASSSATIGQLGSTGSITANTLASSSAVIPYINSTNTISVNKIAFDVTPTTETMSEGELRWNDSDKTLNMQTEVAGVVLQVGQEMYLRATNKTTADLLNGQLVYINGAQGQRPTIDLAIATTSVTADNTIAMVTNDITINHTGYATVFGLVRDVDTSSFTEGDTLYLSSTTFGGYVNVAPSKPHHAVRIGYVVSSSTAGMILLHIDNGLDITELHDVSITSVVSNNLLTYSSSSGYWYNTNNINLSSITSSSAVIGQIGSTGSATFNILASSSAILGQISSTGNITANTLTASSANFTKVYASSAKFGNSTSYSVFEDDGTLNFVGDAIVWEDTNFSSVAAAIGVSAPDLINFNGTNIKIASLDGNATNEELSVSAENPHRYKEGTDLIAHVHWCPTSTAAGTVRFYFDYALVSSTGIITTGTFDLLDSATGAAWTEKRLDLGTITGTNLKIGHQGLFRLYRIPSSTDDTYGDDIGIFTFGYHHQIDTIGSRSITSK